jgi:hypothetical protein
MNFTLNNHLTYTIGGRQFGYRENVYEKFSVNVGSIDQDHYRTSNWIEEQYRTADIVAKEYGKDFVVMFSGGTDSEIVLRSFLEIGITPRICFVKFKGDYNLNDLESAQQVADELDLSLEVLEFDVLEFYRSGQAFEFAAELQCRQMAYLSVYYNILKLQVPAVMGGEMLMRKHVAPGYNKWYYCFRENEDASAMRFSQKYNIPLVNEWFSYTPEMIAYYLEIPTIQNLVNDKNIHKLASVSTKNRTLYKLFPACTRKIKTHGYEQLLGFNGETYHELHKSHIKRLEPSLDGIAIENLKIQLFGKDYVSS